jgi:hypothetical protein
VVEFILEQECISAVPQMTPTRLRKICTAVFFLCLANFFAFVIIAARIGGDALNGKMEDGHYYVANHGKYTEVSASIFQYSRTHAHSVFVTHPLAFIAAFVGYCAQRRQKLAAS